MRLINMTTTGYCKTSEWDYDQKFFNKKDNTRILGCLKRWLKKN
jgi:hypothetical protein